MRFAAGLTFVLFLSSAMPAAATTDWRETLCAQFLDRLQNAIVQVDGLDADARAQIARSAQLRHLRRELRETALFCIRLLADAEDDHSRHTFSDQPSWETAWRR
jgi:hypothetical protein